MMNLKMSDSLLENNQVKLRASQQKFSSMMMDFAENCRNETNVPVLRSSIKKVKADVSRTQFEISKLLMIIESFENITSFPEVINSSSNCDDINTKISRIEENLRKYAALVIQTKMTSDLIQEAIADVVNAYKLDKANITLNTTRLTERGNALTTELSTFIFMLVKAIETEKNIRVNFNTYRNGNCLCASGSSQSSTSPALLLEMISEAENSIKADQSSLKVAITTAASKTKAAVSLKLKDPVSYELTRFTNFFTRISSVNEYADEKLNVTSCGDLLIVVGSSSSKIWLMTQTSKNLQRNCSCLKKYFGEFFFLNIQD